MLICLTGIFWRVRRRVRVSVVDGFLGVLLVFVVIIVVLVEFGIGIGDVLEFDCGWNGTGFEGEDLD